MQHFIDFVPVDRHRERLTEAHVGQQSSLHRIFVVLVKVDCEAVPTAHIGIQQDAIPTSLLVFQQNRDIPNVPTLEVNLSSDCPHFHHGTVLDVLKGQPVDVGQLVAFCIHLPVVRVPY